MNIKFIFQFTAQFVDEFFLDDDKIKRARTVMYFELQMLQASPFLFCPRYELDGIMNITPDRFYRDTAAYLRNTDHDALSKQARGLSEFIATPSYTQYIDTERFEFMRPAVDARLSD